MTDCVLGLDGGGTRTRAAVAGPDGVVLGRGEAGPCNLAAVPLADALAAALEAADAALREAGQSSNGVDGVRAVWAGVAGASFVARRQDFALGLQTRFPNARVAAEADHLAALAGATGGGPGVIVIAGTGSAAYGEDAQGRGHRTGGYGYLIDDAGSGYGVGRSALTAVLRAADGTGPPTDLSGRILDALGLSSVTDLVPAVYGGAAGRVQIAALSRAVSEAADGGDETARAILMRAGGALAVLAEGVARRLFPDPTTPFPVVPVGGLWSAGDVLGDVFARSLRRFAPAAVLSAPLGPPVDGAVRRALALWQEAGQEETKYA